MSEKRKKLIAEYKQMWLDLPNPTRVTEEQMDALQVKEEVMFQNDFSQNDLDAIVQLASVERRVACQ
jgi:hypothetical protein